VAERRYRRGVQLLGAASGSGTTKGPDPLVAAQVGLGKRAA
jgi:hypothetical protein